MSNYWTKASMSLTSTRPGEAKICKMNQDTDFLHATCTIEYKSISCTNSWNDKNCVVKYSLNGWETYLQQTLSRTSSFTILWIELCLSLRQAGHRQRWTIARRRGCTKLEPGWGCSLQSQCQARHPSMSKGAKGPPHQHLPQIVPCYSEVLLLSSEMMNKVHR